MAPRRARYYFGRLNLIAAYDDKLSFLLTGLRSDAFVESHGARWGFFDVSELTRHDEVFIHGTLAKFRAEGEEEVALPEQHRLSIAAIPNQVYGTVPFYLHVRSGLVAFHPHSDIDRNAFVRRFAAVFEKAHDGFFVQAEIEFIQRPESVLAALPRFQRISRLQLRLHPSNPNLRDVWRRTDERLKGLEAKRFEESYTAGPSGSLRVVGDEEIAAKITMAEDGYGTATVDGTRDGRTVTVSTRDNPVTADIFVAPSSAADKTLELLAASFEGIFVRFT